MACKNCKHPASDHGPESGRWQNENTGKWDVIIPGRLCYYMENKGYSQDLCDCPGFNVSSSDDCRPKVFAKAGL